MNTAHLFAIKMMQKNIKKSVQLARVAVKYT